MKFLKSKNLLKNTRIIYIILFLNNFYTFNASAQNSEIENSINYNDLTRSVKLEELFNTQFNYVQDINSYLQYLVQIVSKNKLTNCRSKNFIAWVKYHQKVILELESYKNLEVTPENVNKLILNINLLSNNLIKNIKNRFSNLEDFNLKIERNFKDITLDELNYMSKINLGIIDNLKKEINNIGLTNLNKLVRGLDLLNDKYKITTIAEYTPLASLIAASAIYFTPERFFKNIPVLRNIKERLGSSIYTDPSKFSKKDKKNHKPEEGLGSLFNIFDSKVFTGLAFVTTAYFSNSPLSPYTKFLRTAVSNRWNKLKGFKVDDLITRGEVIKDVTLADERLIGLDSQIQELYKLVNYIVDPEMYDKSNTGLDKGVLLVGPSRNGKTFAARALCGTLNRAMKEKGFSTQFAFKEIKPADINWKENGLRNIIEQAKYDAPCVLFIDEIHNLPLQSKEFGGDILTAFLTEMSGIKTETDARHQFIILGATDKPHLLDKALLQPGRFGNIIYFEKPNYENRKKYFEVNFRNSAIDIKNIDIDILVRQTQNCSYGDLEYIIKNALFVARNLSKHVTQEILQGQINKHVYRLRKEINFTLLEKKHIAAHQAGHALLHILLEPNNKLELVTIAGSWCKIKESKNWEVSKQEAMRNAKSTKYNGLFTYFPAESLNIENADEKIKLAKIKLAGALAEKVILDSTSYSANLKLKQNIFHNRDRAKALDYIKSILFDGLSANVIPKAIRKDLELKAYNMLLELEAEVLELLNNNKNILGKIAQELENKISLTSQNIREIINLN